MAEILLPQAAQIDWSDLTDAVARIVRAAAPLARVHPEWLLGFDVAQSVTDITVRAEDVAVDRQDDVGLVHSWMVGIDKAEVVKNANGDIPEIGGEGFEWDVVLAIWGFFQTTLLRADGVSGDRVAKVESEYVAATVNKNKDGLAMDPPKVLALTKVGVLEFGNIDSHPFSEGVNVCVAQGSMTARIDRTL